MQLVADIGDYLEFVTPYFANAASSVNLVNGAFTTPAGSGINLTLPSSSSPWADWDVQVSTFFIPAATTNVTQYFVGSTNVAGAYDLYNQTGNQISFPPGVPGANATQISSNITRYSFTKSGKDRLGNQLFPAGGPYTVYPMIYALFTVSTLAFQGVFIRARRAGN